MNYLSLLLFLCVGVAQAQETLSVTGRLTNEAALPVPNATVFLDQSAQNYSKFAVTDSLGNFVFDQVIDSIYTLSIFADLYEPFTGEYDPKGKDQNLSEITLIARAKDLAAVTVVAEKPIVQVLPDKTVFNVENAISAQGSTAWELLAQSPGVTVDNSGMVILEGKSGTQVYVDDKPLYLSGAELKNYLMSIQASSIEKIELISQPSAKYDAEGTGGIINLVQKRSEDKGLNGSISNTLTYGQYLRNSSGLVLNYRNKKSSLYGGVNTRFGENLSFINLDRIIGDTRFDASTNAVINRVNRSANLGYDYYLSDKVTLGFLAKGTLNRSESLSKTETVIGTVGQELPDSVLLSENSTDRTFESYSFNANYAYEDTNGRSFNVDIDHGRYRSNAISYQPNYYYDRELQDISSQFISAQESPTVISISSVRADYTQRLWGGVMGLGAKFSHVQTFNDFDFYQTEDGVTTLDESRSNEFDYLEEVTAAYGRYERAWDKWSVEFGVRMEQTHSLGELTQMVVGDDDIVERNYINFFPSGGVTYSLNRKHLFSLRGNRRITRPNYTTLNPFESRTDALSYRRGNPFLQPQYVQSIKLGHRFNYKMNTSLSYSRVTDYFAQVTDADGASANFITTRNIADENILNLGFSYPGKVTKWWSYYISINATHRNYVSKDERFLSQSRNSVGFYVQSSFNLKAGVTAQVSGWYSSPSIWGGTYRTLSMGALNMSVSRSFFKDKLNASIALNDALFTSYWRGVSEFGDLYLVGSGGGDSRSVAFSLSYNFGNDILKKKRSRNTGATSETGRI